MLIIFDWDGTISDTATQIVSAVQDVITEFELPQAEYHDINCLIGMSMSDIFSILWPELAGDSDLATRVLDHYYLHYQARQTEPAPFFPEALVVFNNLIKQGHTLAISTGNYLEDFQRILHQHQVEHLFSAIRCADDEISKPHPSMLTDLLEALNIPVSECLFIGDTRFDMALGQGVGMKTVAVNFDGKNKGQRFADYNPYAEINNLTDILTIVSDIEREQSKPVSIWR